MKMDEMDIYINIYKNVDPTRRGKKYDPETKKKKNFFKSFSTFLKEKHIFNFFDNNYNDCVSVINSIL